MPQVRRAIANVQKLEVEAVEDSTDIEMVVDADHHPDLAAPQVVGHALVLLEWEVDAVAGGLPARGVHAEECVRSIIALRAL